MALDNRRNNLRDKPNNGTNIGVIELNPLGFFSWRESLSQHGRMTVLVDVPLGRDRLGNTKRFIELRKTCQQLRR